MKRNFDQRGFSILSALVAAAIGIIVIMSLSSGMMNSFRLHRGLSQSTDAETATLSIRELLTVSASVAQTFGGRAYPTVGNDLLLTSIKRGDGTDKFTVGQSLDSGVIIQEIRVTPFHQDDTVAQLGNEVALLDVSITFAKTGATAGTSYSRTIPVAVSYDAATHAITGLSQNAASGANVSWVLSNIPWCGKDAAGNDQLLKGIRPDGSAWCETPRLQP